MCEFASFVLTKDGAFWSESSDSHEVIIAEHGLEHLDRGANGLVRIEIRPNHDSIRDLSTWHYRVDQDMFPAWTFQGDPKLEERSRIALARRAQHNHWFEDVIDAGTATAGYAGTATAGDDGTATAGDDGTATAGYAGTATAGTRGTATAGTRGTATAGYAGTVTIRWWDGATQRYRLTVGYVGEGGIEPNTPYRVEDGKLVEVKP